MEKCGPTAIVADPDAATRQAIGDALRELGVNVVGEATDGAHALALFQQHRPDVLVLAIFMPMLAGDVVLEYALRAEPATLGIMIATKRDYDHIRRCVSIGARCCLVRHSEMEDLHQILGSCMASHGLPVAFVRKLH